MYYIKEKRATYEGYTWLGNFTSTMFVLTRHNLKDFDLKYCMKAVDKYNVWSPNLTAIYVKDEMYKDARDILIAKQYSTRALASYERK